MASSSSKVKGSLSSVVSDLVRAQHGAAADSVPADDLDAYVADMLLKEAKEREERWGKEGVAVYFSDEDDQGRPKHRTNKRFLNNIIQGVSDHNQLLAKQDKERDRKELPSNPRGTGNRLFALAKSGMGSKESKRPKKETGDIKGKGRARDDDDDRRSSRRGDELRRSASPERSSRRKRYSGDEEKPSARRKRYSDEDEEPRSRRKRYSDEEESRSRRRRYSDEDEEERSHRRKSRREDYSDTERESRRKRRHAEEKSEARSKKEYSDDEVKPRRSRKHEYSDEERESRRRRRYSSEEERDSRRSKRHRSKHASDEDRPRKHTDKPKSRERSPSRTLSPSLPVPRVLPPSRSPSPPPQNETFQPSHLPSKMDKYFSSTYDPRLDVSVADLTDTNGFIGEGNFDEWSKMIEILKVRKEEKGFREREREEQKLIEREKKRDEKKRKKKGVEEVKDDYAAATGKALLSIGGYAKTKKKTEWGSGPDLSF